MRQKTISSYCPFKSDEAKMLIKEMWTEHAISITNILNVPITF